MKKMLMAALSLSLLGGAIVAAPVTATGDHECDQDECPPRIMIQPEADAIVCGDPRLWVLADNEGSNVDLHYRVVFKTGQKAAKFAPFRRVVKRWVGAGDVVEIGPRWARGKGAKVRVSVQDPFTQKWDPVPVLTFELWNPVSWGVGVCPDSRFGEPDWSDPHYTSRPLFELQ